MNLSILIPMCNAERYIEKCLESLMFQSIAKDDYEVIVFDDGSSDSSLKVVKNFSKKYTNILIYTHANRGVVFTRNKLLKLAKGTYIYFVDADDFLFLSDPFTAVLLLPLLLLALLSSMHYSSTYYSY